MKIPSPLIALSVLVFSATVVAQPASAPNSPDPGTDLIELIRQFASETDQEIVLDPRVRGLQALAVEEPIDDYDSLLAQLRINRLIAIQTSDQILILPEQNLRTMPSQLLQEDDSRVSDHEVVTRVIRIPQATFVVGRTEDGEPIERTDSLGPTLVPILRPMMSQAAQLGAVPNARSLVIVDRYDNVRRIKAVIDEIIDQIDD